MNAETWVPIFTKDGNELFVLTGDFVADNEGTARDIGLGASLVECILWGVTYQRVQRIDVKQTPHVQADLAGTPVAIIAGPAFDEHAAHFAKVLS